MEPQASFDPLSARFLAEPYAAFAALRQPTEEPPPRTRSGAPREADAAPGLVRLGRPYSAWWVVSYELVDEVCRRRQSTFLKPGGTRRSPPRPFGITSTLADGLFFLDGKRHAQVRALMEEVLGKAIVRAPALAEQCAADLLAAVRKQDTGRFDLIADYAGPLATMVFMELLGIPPPKNPAPKSEDEAEADPHHVERGTVDLWLRTMLDGHDKTADRRLRGAAGSAGMALRVYLSGRCAELRRQSGNTILGGIARRMGAKGPDSMSPDEAINTAAHFALGGYLSTEFLIGTGVTNLLRHPEQWQKLCDRPKDDDTLLQGAIDEMLRYDAPFQMADRWAKTDTQLGGLKIAKGSLVTVVYGAANRDPAKFADPDRFDIERADAGGHFGFGEGVHRCIGEALARQVTAVALRTLIDTVPWVRLGEVGAWRTDPYFRSLKRVELLLR